MSFIAIFDCHSFLRRVVIINYFSKKYARSKAKKHMIPVTTLYAKYFVLSSCSICITWHFLESKMKKHSIFKKYLAMSKSANDL